MLWIDTVDALIVSREIRLTIAHKGGVFMAPQDDWLSCEATQGKIQRKIRLIPIFHVLLLGQLTFSYVLLLLFVSAIFW